MDNTSQVELDQARAALDQALNDPDAAVRRHAMTVFMRAIGRLGQAEASSAPLADFVAATAPTLARAQGAMAVWLNELAMRAEGSYDYDEYRLSRAERTSLDVLRALYKDGPAAALMDKVETDDIDEALARLAADYGP